MPKKRKPKLSARAQKALYKKRSEASKKGWITRRANIVERGVERAEEAVQVAKTIDISTPKGKKIRDEVMREANDSDDLKNFVKLLGSIATPEQLVHMAKFRKDGSLGLYESSLRHVEDSDDLIARLDKANADGILEQVALLIANEQKVAVSEVFTLFNSP